MYILPLYKKRNETLRCAPTQMKLKKINKQQSVTKDHVWYDSVSMKPKLGKFTGTESRLVIA